MCDIKDSDSDPESSSEPKEGVISLCDHRRRVAIEENTRQLIAHLESIHRKAIDVHNDIINRAQVSVLTELCRTAGLFLDLIDEHLQAAVITPAALYGDSGVDVFGKKPLQKRITRAVDDADAAQLLEQLNSVHPVVWEYEPRCDGPTDWATPIAGADHQQRCEIAGVIVRAGELSEEAGVYSGWPLSFEGERFLVFGHRLDRLREVSVRNLLASRSDRRDPAVWRRAELTLLRAIIDPEDLHQRPPGGPCQKGIRRPASRKGLLLMIHRALWRHFAEPEEGLTIHAHIAALADDLESRRAFVDEVRQIMDTALLKSGGLNEDIESIDIDEVLCPYFIDGRGRWLQREPLHTHPVQLLLLEDSIWEDIGLHRRRPIIEALTWAREEDGHPTSRVIELAWMTYRMEQNLMAAYGFQPGRARPGGEVSQGLAFATRSPVLPNIRTLFDPRFMECSLADLDLEGAAQSRLRRGLEEVDSDLRRYSLADVGRDEQQLKTLCGVGQRTCNAVRWAILELATDWRWRRCNIDPRQVCWSNAEATTKGAGDLIDGLDRLSHLLDD